ncbi:helicase-related protein [Altererythrobacter sp. MF3-039]|uniref:helicase-related protein n=1 Tax=Altererythrobacter sp. MF3-039 TaxID=3252901 RepID=UPI00390CC922
MDAGTIKAVLGPTNTGKTHLAIERMCGHSSGVMGFPLRLLAREVYDRIVAIKGERQVALITGEERIEPPDARYFCCTAEAMPRLGGDAAFVAVDEAQLGANFERGHIFTDRLLNARGREETLILGSATLAPLVRQLVPSATVEDRPRFSTLTHAGPAKLSRLPPRSAIVAFSTEQVYVMAEMLRRFRGGAAVVMGALSPETRNKQVELFQNGEVDYIVATDAIGMGLNLDIDHVAFGALSKFDGRRKRRLEPAEMAQIAGRAGRHQRDGSFGVLAGGKGPALEFTAEEVYAIEEHRFAPLTKLFWREPEPRFDSLEVLVADLEAPPEDQALSLAPEAIDLAVLKRLSEESLAEDIRGAAQVRRFWEACCLPDFRQLGIEAHARFVTRLWQDLRHDYLGADYVAARISELDNVQGDIDTLQGRIAAIRSWAYVCQRPDWVLARDEMAARARAVEARLSDALHARLTERFVSRRTAILLRSMGQDGAMLPVSLTEDGAVLVEDESIGILRGFRFDADPSANHQDRKMLLAAGERAMPKLLGERAASLVRDGFEMVEIENGALCWEGDILARLDSTGPIFPPRLVAGKALDSVPANQRSELLEALGKWLDAKLAPLEPLANIEAATRDPAGGSEARALLLKLLAGQGYVARKSAGLEHLPKELRPYLRKLGVHFGGLDIYAPVLLKPAARQMLRAIGRDRRRLEPSMQPVIDGKGKLPSGYRPAGEQAIRIDIADKLIRAAHESRVAQVSPGQRKFRVDESLAISTGLTSRSFERLLGAAGFKVNHARTLGEGAHGPPAPHIWSWRPHHTPASKGPAKRASRKPQFAAQPGNPFAELRGLVK